MSAELKRCSSISADPVSRAQRCFEMASAAAGSPRRLKELAQLDRSSQQAQLAPWNMRTDQADSKLLCRSLLEEILDDDEELAQLNLSSRPAREDRQRMRERDRLKRTSEW